MPPASYPMLFPSQEVSFDADAFDELVSTQGVEMEHYRAFRCPIGMSDPDDIRRPHEHHANCSNGFLYFLAGCVKAGFMGNSKESHFADQGRLDGSTANIVVRRFYDDKPTINVKLCQFDRVYLKEPSITVENWHTFAAHVTGRDRLQFPAVNVYHIVDSHGNSYTQDVDFTVVNGQLVWGQRRPGIDPDTGKGVVCSARYSYRPFWYVQRMMHEVRVAQIEDDFGNRAIQLMPQGALIQREHFFEKAQVDAQVAADARQAAGPSDGLLGPR